MFDKLEPRRLFSDSFQVIYTQGLLQVVGTPGEDQIEVSLQRTEALTEKAEQPSGTLVVVRLAGEEVFQEHFNDDALAAVHVLSGAGNDSISFTNFDSPVGSIIFAEEGHDFASVWVAGNAWPTTVYAGGGDDEVTLANGRESLGGYLVFGEGGNDIIHGSRFADTLYGDSDIPMLTDFAGGDGDDVIYGGDGDDQLFGQEGNDWLIAEAGDDFLAGGEGRDVLDGGDGFDLADADASDVLISIDNVINLVHTSFEDLAHVNEPVS
jgi:Ca2+-binding RTX toxin-like protein